MSFTTVSTDLHPTNKSLLAKQWFDYTPEMHVILDALNQRVFNLEIALQANNQILNRSQTKIDNDVLNPKTNIMITQNQLSQKVVRNSIDTLSQRSARNSLITDKLSLNLPLEKQLQKLNLSSHISFEQTIIDSIDPSNNSLHSSTSKHLSSSLSKLPSLDLTPNQMKIRAYELAAIFENAFDQLNIIHNTLSINNQSQLNKTDSNNVNLFPLISSNSNCDPFALNLAGIFIMNEHDKFRYEIEYFFHILMLLFRALLLDSQTDFETSINNIHNHLPSKELNQLNNRLKISQDQISKFSFTKKHFHRENSQDFHTMNLQLKDHLMEEKYRSKVALRYCNDWKTNHILQWIQMLLQIERDYTKTIHQYINILKQTDLTHQATIEILIKQNNEMKIKANKWYDYYQNETSRFERELTNFRQEFNQIKRQRQNMYEEYQRMKRIVDEYNQMKINEKFILDKQKQEEEAIKHIQAWWRGTMNRQRKQKRRRKTLH